MQMKHQPAASPFKGLKDIEYFKFEEDFIEKNVRCIPMIVRFKMDEAAIKLKLAEWSRFSVEERIELAVRPCSTPAEVAGYKDYLADLIIKATGKEATLMEVNKNPLWAIIDAIPGIINEQAANSGIDIPVSKWAALTDLQRFALVKLSKEGHENKNFSKALHEFDLHNRKSHH